LVLSGGFSRSEYFRDAITRKYAEQGMKIIAPDEP
jgi:hypothetical protein